MPFYQSRLFIKNPENECFISVASLWETAIKKNIGKLILKEGFSSIRLLLIRNEIEILPILFKH